VIDEFFAGTWQDILQPKQQGADQIVDAGPLLLGSEQTRDMQVALECHHSLGSIPINDDTQ